MNLSSLKPPVGQKHRKKRIGRGMEFRPGQDLNPWSQGRALHLRLQHHARL